MGVLMWVLADYVPSFFATPASIEVMRHMKRRRICAVIRSGM
jgi:hypothetical protein